MEIGECTCKTEIEQKLLDQFKKQAPTAQRHQAELQSYGFKVVGNTMQLAPYMQFKLTADYPTSTRASRHRAKVGVMHFSFCPFCGQSLKEGR